MSLIIESILWGFSIFIGLLGITFGIIASRSATQANKSVQDMISNSIVVEESQKLFFEGLKSSITQSRRAVKALKTKGISYYDYSILSADTRIHPLSQRVFKAFLITEYKDLAESYVENKKFLDKEYSSIIGDFALLKTEKEVPEKIREKLIDYHVHSIDSAGAIIKTYASLTHTTIIKTK